MTCINMHKSRTLRKYLKVPGRVYLIHIFNLIITVEFEGFIFLNFNDMINKSWIFSKPMTYKLFNSKRKIISMNKIHYIYWNYKGIKFLLTFNS